MQLYKCNDKAIFVFKNNNELDKIKVDKSYLYIKVAETIWRNLGFQIHNMYSAVNHLHVHLQNIEHVYFR